MSMFIDFDRGGTGDFPCGNGPRLKQVYLSEKEINDLLSALSYTRINLLGEDKKTFCPLRNKLMSALG